MSDSIFMVADALDFVQRWRVRFQVRNSHLLRQKKKDELSMEIAKRALEFEKWLESRLKEEVRKNPAYDWFSRVKGIGEINIGKVIGFIDIEKATHISNLWRYAGFSVANGQAERRTKGEKLHFNMTLKVMCWRLAKSLIRAKGKYYEFYKAEKKRLSAREEEKGRKIIESAKLPKEKGKRVETDEFVGLGHVDMMAMRKMIKLFLSHLWLEWRRALDLPISAPYVQDHLNHSDIISPEEMIES